MWWSDNALHPCSHTYYSQEIHKRYKRLTPVLSVAERRLFPRHNQHLDVLDYVFNA